MTSNEIREKFLDFFNKKDHHVCESASLLPTDKTILFNVAGMVPFKPFFLGKSDPSWKRTTSCQKCIRTNDIENVGYTDRHHTFFEMLGNFSFGDYFKKEAIKFCWEFLIDILNLDKNKLYITVYKDDKESRDIWIDSIGISADRVFNGEDKDNFWAVGPVGPCGPCSEVYYDFGAEFGCKKDSCNVFCECGRYLEIWNLVFMEFNRLEDGKLVPLPKKNIDTGMGLERIAAVVQNVYSNFDTDIFQSIISEIKSIFLSSNIDLSKQNKNIDIMLKIVADHIRSAVFLISDGVIPSNEGRGYVLRRIIRKAMIKPRLLGQKIPFLYLIVKKVAVMVKNSYPEISDNIKHIENTIFVEEKNFLNTLEENLVMVSKEIDNLKRDKILTMPSDIVFKLYDTYGLPYELTEELCNLNNISIDKELFMKKLLEQKNRAKDSRIVKKDKIEEGFIVDIWNSYGETKFFGYNQNEIDAKVLYIQKDEKNSTKLLKVIFDKTVFYAESGGQVADTGYVYNNNFRGKVVDVQRKRDIFIHYLEIETGNIKKDDILTLEISFKNRANIKKNHTATHLLHSALRNVLGDHIKQAGSKVEAKKLRFDYIHYDQLSVEDISKIENIVNSEIFKNNLVETKSIPIKEAISIGAKAFFEDKYKDIVRVVSIGDISIELCGGTHVSTSSEIGLFKIIKDEGISSGVRRIEAITGLDTLNYLSGLETKIDMAAQLLKADRSNFIDKIKKNVDELKLLKKEQESLENEMIGYEITNIIYNCKNIKGINVIVKAFENKEMKTLRRIMDLVKSKLKSCIVVFGSNNGSAIFISGVTKDLVSDKMKASNIMSRISNLSGGGGGGSDIFAQSGAKDGRIIKKVLNEIEVFISEIL